MDKLEQLEHDFIEMKNDVSDIKTALLGSEYNDGKGFAFKVIENEARLAAVEKWREFEQQRRADKEKTHSKYIAIGLFVFALLGAVQAVITVYLLMEK